MTFLHPLALLGLAAAGIPALLHLLERRVPPEAEFPPIRYLSEAERQSARRLKLRHLLLLVLRTTLIALIVMAAARPLVRSRGAVGGGAHEPTALALILDNSPSSGAVVDGHPLIERLKTVVRAAISRAAPGDRLWLMLSDGVARAGSRDALLATVDSVVPGWRRLDLTGAVARASRLVDAEPLPGREVAVVSDLQRTTLGEGRADIPRGVRVLALAPASSGEALANRGVAQARVEDGALAITVVGTPGGSPAPVTVRLRPASSPAGRSHDVGRALAAPGSSANVPLPSVAPGWWIGEAVLDPDELRADDRRAFVWRVALPARVRADPGAGPFVAAALAVLTQGRRIVEGGGVVIGERLPGGTGTTVLLPPVDPALIGQANRALASRGVRWRFGGAGTPGPIGTAAVAGINGLGVTRRYRLEGAGGGGDTTDVLATVNDDPWLVRAGDVVLLGSRLDTAWTALPASPAFVPFVDVLVNRLARGEAPVTEAEGPPGVAFQVRGADTVGAVVSAPDARESDLTPAAPDVVRRAIGAELLDEGRFAVEQYAGTRRTDVSTLLLALALLVAGVELGVATRAH
ncbi:MAG: hypothetical protein AUH06_06640 [Gemmatimonadetes bacterium 13_2_20CM_69_27]|nr:MAG: hypothetical protein AUH06_06640 [Gemmatimonadetes bacterium 13_2_20CM_69_27]OLB50582.1 MAG: hypothetical protein AUI13_15360 [Gemmatimonadetes bacterium 13_2_20CM_2_69_23]OLD59549.1 MAG: hypothetical protein AUF60_05020 [Gemmatimonadetes bacterium 13_1_20CM_69_28]